MKFDKEASKKAGISVMRPDSPKAEKVEKSKKEKKSHETFEAQKEETAESEFTFRDEA